MHEPHVYMVADMAKFLRPRFYVEVGAAMGICYQEVRPYCERAACVDIHRMFDSSELVNMDSLEFIDGLEDGSVDMAFIDADHESTRAFADFLALAPKMGSRGVVMLHDVYPPDEKHLDPGACHDSWMVPEMVRALGGWDVVVLAAEYGVAVCSRRHRGPAWMNLESQDEVGPDQAV